MFVKLALVGALPVLALAVFAYLVSADAVERLVHGSNDGTATITGALVEREFGHWTEIPTSIAGFPTQRRSVASGDVEAVRRRLRIFVEAQSRVGRAFGRSPGSCVGRPAGRSVGRPRRWSVTGTVALPFREVAPYLAAPTDPPRAGGSR